MVDKDKKILLVKEMYELLASTSAEMIRLEEIIAELIPLSDEAETPQLIMMGVNVKKYRLKFSKMTKAIFDQKFNIVELCRKLHKK